MLGGGCNYFLPGRIIGVLDCWFGSDADDEISLKLEYKTKLTKLSLLHFSWLFYKLNLFKILQRSYTLDGKVAA